MKLYQLVAAGSQEWAWIERWIATELATARASLETVGLDVVHTESLRARIAVLRGLLKEAEPPPPTQGSDNPYPFGGPDED